MSINDRIKEARKNKGITQEQLGELIGVAKTTITGYEKNREPSAAKVGEIADALDVDVNFLFQDEVKKLHENRATPLEMEHLIKKYRDLDDHGKKMVDFTLKEEYERSVAEKKKSDNIVPMAVRESSDYEVNAAHADDYMGAPDELKQLEEDIMDDENF